MITLPTFTSHNSKNYIEMTFSFGNYNIFPSEDTNSLAIEETLFKQQQAK
jgi:hypothetical protein